MPSWKSTTARYAPARGDSLPMGDRPATDRASRYVGMGIPCRSGQIWGPIPQGGPLVRQGTGRDVVELRPFQRQFLSRALAPDIRTAALSIPRGNGKSTMCAWLASRALTPGDDLYRAGAESHIVAASIGQARRTTFKLLRELMDGRADYRIAESSLACHVLHKPTNTRVSVLASSGKTAQGLVRCPWVFADEPGSWELAGGLALHHAIQGAMGKPCAALKAIYIGTLAPLATGPGHWWYDLIDAGSGRSTYVQALRGDPAKWDQASEIRRCNPLRWAFADSRAVLFEERDKARSDSRLRAAFQSFYMNRPTGDESTMLLTTADWERSCSREVPERSGRPAVGVDLGAGRSWSAAVAVWRSGRVEALAVAPGVPTIAAQEKRDGVPEGTYQRLVETGRLTIASGLRVPSPRTLVDRILPWRPATVTCDRFRLPEMQDAAGGRLAIRPRVSRWSDAAFDIRSLRKAAADGPLSVEPESRGLLTASLAAAMVRNDDQGNTRLAKRDPGNNTGRDDVAAALVLAAGAWARIPAPCKVRIHVA